jgi:hypothetical protein
MDRPRGVLYRYVGTIISVIGDISPSTGYDITLGEFVRKVLEFTVEQGVSPKG